MERDDLQEIWSRCEAHLNRSEALNRPILTDLLTRRAQSRLTLERRMLAVEIVANFIGIVVLGAVGFNRAAPSVVPIASAILLAALIATNIALIGIAVALKRIDFGQPVVKIQAELERIKMRRARLTAVVLLAAPLLWTPLLVVALAFFGADAKSVLGVRYLVANVAFGAAVAAVGWISARYVRARSIGSTWPARMADALSGNAYRDAADALVGIERFAA